MVYAGGMLKPPDIHHQLNSRLATIKATLFLLERDLPEKSDAVAGRLATLQTEVDVLHQLLKTVLEDVTKASD